MQQKFFDSTIELFEKYLEKMNDERPKSYNWDLGRETLARLKQLSFLYEKIRKHERHCFESSLKFFSSSIAKVIKKEQPPEVLKSQQEFALQQSLAIELRTYVEAFYYFHHRANRRRQLIKV